MNIHTITEEQLVSLEAAVWGARFPRKKDWHKYREVVAAIKRQENIHDENPSPSIL